MVYVGWITALKSASIQKLSSLLYVDENKKLAESEHLAGVSIFPHEKAPPPSLEARPDFSMDSA